MKSLPALALVAFCMILNSCQVEKEKNNENESQFLTIQANLVFFYYPDLEEAERFYAGILGLEKVLDYGFAKILRISSSSYIGLVDETKGMHNPSEPKTVTLSFVTQEIDQWFHYLQGQKVEMHSRLKDASRHPTRGFVAYDPVGYYLEFERFLDHPQNDLLLDKLAQVQTLYPQKGQITSRPSNLGIKANIIWLYYKDVPQAQVFYEKNLASRLLVDQGFAKIYSSSLSGFLGLVDEAQGLHRFTQEKAVNVCFLTDQIDDWYAHLQEKGIQIRDSLETLQTIPVRAFVAYDAGRYFIEFDRFLDDPKNRRILELLR